MVPRRIRPDDQLLPKPPKAAGRKHQKAGPASVLKSAVEASDA
jgi:hypothetical protein